MNIRPQNFVSLETVSALSAPAFTLVGDIFAHTELIAAPVFAGDTIAEKTRPNLKVQDGCDNRCSFCIIPSVRGQSRSMKLDRVIEEANALVAAGYREIVLSGINLGRWGRDFQPQQKFEQLVRALLEHTRHRKNSHQLRRAHGLERRPDRSGRRLAAYRQARACSAAIRQ